MIANCVSCRGHYMVVSCSTFCLSLQWQCDTWTLSSPSSALDCVWTWSFPGPKNWEFDLQIWPRTYLSAPRLLLPRTVCSRHLFSLVGAPYYLVILARSYPFWCSAPRVEIWKADVQPRNGFSAAYAFLFPVRMFYPLMPPNRHSPLAHLGLKRQCDAEYTSMSFLASNSWSTNMSYSLDSSCGHRGILMPTLLSDSCPL